MFNAVNGSKMNSLKTIQEFSRTPEHIQGQQVVFQESRTERVLIANSRTIIGAQGRLATLEPSLLRSNPADLSKDHPKQPRASAPQQSWFGCIPRSF